VATAATRRRRPAAEHGFGLAGLILSLLVLGAVSAAAVMALGSGSGTGLGGAGGLTGAGGGSDGSSGLGSTVSRAYDLGAQTTLKTVEQNVLDASVAGGGFAGLDLSPYGVVAGPSTSAQTVSGVLAAGGDGATLAVQSRTGTCWFAWVSAGASWYGAEVHAPSCAAVALDGAPTAGTSGGITWQAGSFPAS